MHILAVIISGDLRLLRESLLEGQKCRAGLHYNEILITVTIFFRRDTGRLFAGKYQYRICMPGRYWIGRSRGRVKG